MKVDLLVVENTVYTMDISRYFQTISSK